MTSLFSRLCGCGGQGALEDDPAGRDRPTSMTARALFMVGRDGSFLPAGSQRLPDDFNCDTSTRAYEVVLSGADPGVTRAATLEVGEDGVAFRKANGGAILRTFLLEQIAAWKSSNDSLSLHISEDGMQTFQTLTALTDRGGEIASLLQGHAEARVAKRELEAREQVPE
mmetsp:Transcript_1871/g.4417  ORF Transcript_1871/g.4417 Transcript_1871/m.4417 type:complete len:169 (+) Transcript_1871:169-675(+)